MSGLPAPSPRLRVCVVVPARDEELLVGRCIGALARQREIAPDEMEVLLVLDRCADATERRARECAARHPGLALHTLDGAGRGAGPARRLGMEAACRRFEALCRPDGVIASTDADSEPAPDWLARQLEAFAAGARAVGGLIVLDDHEGGVPERARSLRSARSARRHAAVLAASPDAEHGFFGGASLAVTAEAYRRVGGIEDRTVLEDQALEQALVRGGSRSRGRRRCGCGRRRAPRAGRPAAWRPTCAWTTGGRAEAGGRRTSSSTISSPRSASRCPSSCRPARCRTPWGPSSTPWSRSSAPA